MYFLRNVVWVLVWWSWIVVDAIFIDYGDECYLLVILLNGRISGTWDCQCILSPRVGPHPPIWRNCQFDTRPWIGAKVRTILDVLSDLQSKEHKRCRRKTLQKCQPSLRGGQSDRIKYIEWLSSRANLNFGLFCFSSPVSNTNFKSNWVSLEEELNPSVHQSSVITQLFPNHYCPQMCSILFFFRVQWWILESEFARKCR